MTFNIKLSDVTDSPTPLGRNSIKTRQSQNVLLSKAKYYPS